MSLASRAGDLYYSFRFVKMLTTPFEDTDAYKLGIIDENGNRIKTKKVSTSEEKSAFTTFHRLVFNVKKLLEKLPGGQSRLASYAAALFLLKEKYELSDSTIEKIVEKSNLETLDFLAEKSEWYLLPDKQLSPGIYRIRESKLDNVNCQEIAKPKDKIRIQTESYPVGDIFGLDVYEATHLNTNQKIYVVLGEIYK
mgnify:FL=1